MTNILDTVATYSRQVFNSLGLSYTCRPSIAAAEVEVQRCRESQPASLCEGRDDQPWCTAQILIAINKIGVSLRYVTQLLLFIPFISQMPESNTRII